MAFKLHGCHGYCLFMLHNSVSVTPPTLNGTSLLTSTHWLLHECTVLRKRENGHPRVPKGMDKGVKLLLLLRTQLLLYKTTS